MIAEKMKIWWQTAPQSVRCSRRGIVWHRFMVAENVFDFSLGNPNVPAPEAVNRQ